MQRKRSVVSPHPTPRNTRPVSLSQQPPSPSPPYLFAVVPVPHQAHFPVAALPHNPHQSVFAQGHLHATPHSSSPLRAGSGGAAAAPIHPLRERGCRCHRDRQTSGCHREHYFQNVQKKDVLLFSMAVLPMLGRPFWTRASFLRRMRSILLPTLFYCLSAVLVLGILAGVLKLQVFKPPELWPILLIALVGS